MRLIVHDFIGHAFPVQLSRALAQRGHDVLHLHFPDFETPKGQLEPLTQDPPTFQIRGLRLRGPYRKYSYIRRYFQEAEYSALCSEAIRSYRPDLVLSGQASPSIQLRLLKTCRANGIRFVPWVQDLHGIAISNLFTLKYGMPGRLLGNYFQKVDDRVLRGSDAAVFITDDFQDLCRHVPHHPHDWHTVQNWVPLQDLPLSPRQNTWSQAHGLSDKFTFLYAGTLGLKHNPALLLELALRYRQRPDVAITVVTQGMGREWLLARKVEHGLDNLLLLDFQPFQAVPDMIGSADVLVGILEPDAGSYCVPSKVLTYLCANRPMLLAMPRSNLAARIVQEHQSGLVVDPRDTPGFLAAAETLASDRALSAKLASNGRAYAETHFDIAAITSRFERIFAQALSKSPHKSRNAVLQAGISVD